jgi:hypothetical protein
VSYLLTCLHCERRIATSEHVGQAEVGVIEKHLRAEHPDALPARADFAEVFGHVRVRMG